MVQSVRIISINYIGTIPCCSFEGLYQGPPGSLVPVADNGRTHSMRYIGAHLPGNYLLCLAATTDLTFLKLLVQCWPTFYKHK